MGWFSNDEHEEANNEGQKDGAEAAKTGESQYTGSLLGGRSSEEQRSYNKGYENGQKSVKD
jgi:hypothetical protein